MADMNRLDAAVRASATATTQQTATSAGAGADARRTDESAAEGASVANHSLTARDVFVRVSRRTSELAFKVAALKQFHEYYAPFFDEHDQIEGRETDSGFWAADDKYGLSKKDQMNLDYIICEIALYNPHIVDGGIFKKSDFVEYLNRNVNIQTEAQKDKFLQFLKLLPQGYVLPLNQFNNQDGHDVYFTLDELKLLISKLGRIAFMPCNESVINVQLKSAEEVDVLIAYVKEIDQSQATQHLRLSYTVKRVQLVGLEDEHIARLKAVLRSATISVKKTGDLIKAARP